MKLSLFIYFWFCFLFSCFFKGLTERLEQYMTRSRSFGSLTPSQVIDELKAQDETVDSSDEDDWGGLDDWDLGVIEYQDQGDGRSPLEPSSKLWEKKVYKPCFYSSLRKKLQMQYL